MLNFYYYLFNSHKSCKYNIALRSRLLETGILTLNLSFPNTMTLNYSKQRLRSPKKNYSTSAPTPDNFSNFTLNCEKIKYKDIYGLCNEKEKTVIKNSIKYFRSCTFWIKNNS